MSLHTKCNACSLGEMVREYGRDRLRIVSGKGLSLVGVSVDGAEPKRWFAVLPLTCIGPDEGCNGGQGGDWWER